MRLNTLFAEGAKHSAKRLGRGIGSGLGPKGVIKVKSSYWWRCPSRF